MTGNIFNIKSRTKQDGPGIRTTIYLKGCPLACWWCLNPDNINNELRGNETKSESKSVGKIVTTEEVWDEIRKDIKLYEDSGGGVTFSGGEPLHQIEFLQMLLMKSKAYGIHTAVDTTGFSSRIDFDSIIQFTDLFLYDIKHLNDNIHKQFTGVSNRIILQNLESIIKQKKEVIIRYPLIPGFNNSQKFVDEFVRYLSKYQRSINEIQLLPFERWAVYKYHKIKEDNMLNFNEAALKEDLETVKNKFLSNGFSIKLRN